MNWERKKNILTLSGNLLIFASFGVYINRFFSSVFELDLQLSTEVFLNSAKLLGVNTLLCGYTTENEKISSVRQFEQQ